MTHSSHSHDYSRAAAILRERTGVVIPVYFPRRTNPRFARRLLEETARGFSAQMADPRCVCLSADGKSAADTAAEVARDLGLRLVIRERNRGKLHAVRAGMRLLLRDRRLECFVIIDQDGDHFANELLNFVRALEHVAAATRNPRVMVQGRRLSRHRPMGFLRGELEELADRVLLDALNYHSAVTATPLPLQFLTTHGEFPDFHSGYKLFSRPAAKAIFAGPARRMGLPDDCYYRHAVESVITVEAVLGDVTLAEVNRSTWDEQPVSVFGLMNRRHLTADMIIWPCKRLRVPPRLAAQWLDNHLPRLLLGAYAPAGKEELLAVRRLTLQALGVKGAPAREIVRPRFI